jgi:uncharacterized protein (TIGR02172 family)
MDIVKSIEGQTVALHVRQRLDASNAQSLQQDWLSDGINQLVVDLSECDYVSSAGLRSFMLLARAAESRGASMALVNVPAAVYETLHVTGFTKILDVRRKPREISIDGLELLSAGVCGQCFRLDSETIIKLYNDGIAPEVAEKEKQFARAAFIAGVPTALSYDVVTCGSRTGVVYEMLDAQLFSALIRATPDRIGEHGALLARIARTFHSKQADPSIFPDLKDRLRGDIQSLRGLLPDDDVDLLAARLETIPDGDSLVHYDLHTSNIMIRNGEPMIIDMGDLSRGHYFFDVGLLAMIFGYEEHGNCEFVTKIPNDTGRRLYEHFIDSYFADRSAEDRAFFDRNQAFLASLRLISSISILPPSRDILVEKVRDHMLPKIRAEARVN